MSEADPIILVTPDFSHRAGVGMVTLRVGPEEIRMLPERARLLATQLFDASEQAESEALVFDFLIRKFILEPDAARYALAEFRLHRERMRNAEA